MKRAFLFLIACVIANASVGAGTAQQDGGLVTLDIAPQPLAQALTQLAMQADLKLVYYASVEDGLLAPAVVGRYTPAAALHLLLKNTSLRAAFRAGS